jgi:hypothetical protein
MADRSAGALEPIQAAPRPDPDGLAAWIFIERIHRIDGQAAGVGRIVPVVGELLCHRVPCVDPAPIRAHQQLAILELIDRGHIVATQCRLCRGAVMGGGLGGATQAVEAVRGPNPQITRLVLGDGPGHPRTRVPVVDERPCLGVKSLQPAVIGSHPQVAGAILVQGGDAVAAQAGRIVRVMAVDCDGSRLAVQPVEPSRLRADPQVALPVFYRSQDDVVAQTVRRIGPVSVDGKLAGRLLVAADPHRGADPHHAGAVLIDRQDRVATQAPGVSLVVAVVDEPVLTLVELIEPILRADPQPPGAVLQNSGHEVISQAERIVRVVLVTGKGLGGDVQPVEPTHRADP